jgi:hypothetical protein
MNLRRLVSRKINVLKIKSVLTCCVCSNTCAYESLLLLLKNIRNNTLGISLAGK